MAEEIVACPGCAKKFRIPEGAPPGAFPCTACGVSVPYGAPAPAAAKGGAKPAARPAAKAAAPAARPAAPARAAAPQRASAARAEAPRSRRSARDDDEPPKKSNQGLIWGGIVVGGGALIGLVYAMTKPAAPTPAPTTTPAPVAAKPADKPKPPAPKVETPKPAEQPKPAAPEASGAAPAPAPDESKPAASATPPAPKPADAPKPSSSSTTYATLGSTVASVAGVTDEERATFDKYVALAMDQSSAKDGAEAEGKLIRAGKKAVPSILTAFGKQSTTGKWATDADQWSADKLQDLLHRITGADGLNQKDDFWPRFMSGAPPEDFLKAANLWFNWWNNKGQLKDKYKPRND